MSKVIDTKKIFSTFCVPSEPIGHYDSPNKIDFILQKNYGFGLWHPCFTIWEFSYNEPKVCNLMDRIDDLKRFKRSGLRIIKTLFPYRLENEIKKRMSRGSDPANARLNAFSFLANEDLAGALDLAIEKGKVFIDRRKLKGSPNLKNTFANIWNQHILKDHIFQLFEWLIEHGMNRYIPGKFSYEALEKAILRYEKRSENYRKIIEEAREVFNNRNDNLPSLFFDEEVFKKRNEEIKKINEEIARQLKEKSEDYLEAVKNLRTKIKNIKKEAQEILIEFPDGSRLTRFQYLENKNRVDRSRFKDS